MTPVQTLYSEQLTGIPFDSTGFMMSTSSTLTIAPTLCIPMDEWENDDSEESEEGVQVETEVDPDLEDNDSETSDDKEDDDEDDDVFEQYLFGEDDEQ